MLRVALALLPGARMFDLAVACEAFRPAHLQVPALDLELRRCALARGPVEIGDGAVQHAERTLAWTRRADLVVVPGLVTGAPDPDPQVLAALVAAHRRGAGVAALCSGAFVLAAAGLLDGRRATTHWALAPELARRHPQVRVEPDALFVGDDDVWTSAGVAAGIDLCMALLRDRLGARPATDVARAMVAAPHRAGDQAQYMARPVPAQVADARALDTARAALAEAPARPWTLTELAARAHLAPRTFTRRFRDETGTSVHRWLVTERLERARALLESGDLPVAAVAQAVGFTSPVTFRQQFVAHVGVPPAQYRRTFAGAGAGS